jgi:predicted nucleotidyltransferase
MRLAGFTRSAAKKQINDGARMKLAIDAQIKEVLQNFSQLNLVVLFGSIASGRQRLDSDLDIAVASRQPLTAQEKIAMISALAACTGRSVDLVDLKVVAEPLLGQILQHGRRIMGSDTLYGELISRHLFEQADFMPYRSRLLAERRLAWIGR